MTSDVAGPSSAGERHRPAGRAGPGRSPGRWGRTARRHWPARRVARRTVIGSRSARIRSMASSRKRVTPTPAVPPSSRVRVTPCAASSSAAARRRECLFSPHEARARVPDGHAGILRSARDRPNTLRRAASARLACDDRRSPRATSRQHAQRAARRGVALLHQVAADDGLPVGARARRAPGARGEQAAPPDGPPDRVLQPDRGAGARPVRRGRRDAPRGGHRPRAATGDRHRARAALGRGLRRCRARPVGRARRRRAAARRPRHRRPGRTATVRPVRGRAAGRRRRWSSCRPSRPGRSIWSRPTRRTTCSCR